MPMNEAQMRDCIFDALSQHLLNYERPAEMVITWVAMKRRTQDAAIVRGLLDGSRVAFEEAEDKVFGEALWALFSEGTLAPVFKAQRYGGKGSWQEGEFKLTSRGMRGFQASVPKRDVEAYLAAVRRACAGMHSHDAVLAYAEQAVRAARGELLLAAATMTALALEAALAELADALAPAGERPAPHAGPLALAAWLDAALAANADYERAIAATPELADGLAPVLAGARAIAPTRDPAGQLLAGAPSGDEVDAGLAALTGCLERIHALLPLRQARAAR